MIHSDFIELVSKPNHCPYASNSLFVVHVSFAYFLTVLLLVLVVAVVAAVAAVAAAVEAAAGFFLLGDLDCFNLGHPSPVIKCNFHPSSVAGSMAIKHNGHCT